MPVFVEDPSQLSKSRLKSDLVAHNVALPSDDSKKQVYVELHLKHIDHTSTADFSSDEEEDLATPDDDVVAVTEETMLDPSRLTDDELRAVLIKYGVNAGPITATTRALYERRLIKGLQVDVQTSLNGTADAELYSDSEEEVDREEHSIAEQAVPEPDSSLDQSQPENPVPEKPVTVDEPVTELSADTAPAAYSSPPGFIVTRRRPIKGAAGRPVTYKYPDTLPLTPVSPTTAERQELEGRLVPIWVRILVFVVVACLLILIYTYVNDDNLFASLLDSLSQWSEEERLLTSSEDTPVTDPISSQG